jgi:hypothetical protein
MSVLINHLSCPECGQFTTVIDYFVLGSTDGPVEHVRMSCPERHVYFGPMASIVRTTELVSVPLPSISMPSPSTSVPVPERIPVPS